MTKLDGLMCRIARNAATIHPVERRAQSVAAEVLNGQTTASRSQPAKSDLIDIHGNRTDTPIGECKLANTGVGAAVVDLIGRRVDCPSDAKTGPGEPAIRGKVVGVVDRIVVDI